MKVTKYPQSCLVLEKSGHRIVIDPGSFFVEKFKLDDLGQIEAVLYTHQHPDHFDRDLLKEIQEHGIDTYGNADVAQQAGEGMKVVTHGKTLEIAGFSVLAHDLPHFPLDGRGEMPQNTGYIIDGTFFDPGDGVETTGVNVPDLAGPIGNPFGMDKVKELARSVGAKRILPIHYTNQAFFKSDVDEFAASSGTEFEVIVLQDGESAEF